MVEAAALLEAIRKNDGAQVRLLIDSDAALLAAAARVAPGPVLTACYHRAPAALESLLAHRPHLELSLYEAAAVGDIGRVEQLLDRDPKSLASLSADGWTPLHLACFFSHTGLSRLLIKRGAPVCARSENGAANHPLHAAVAGHAPPELVLLLLESGADPRATQAGGFTALHSAAQSGDAVVAELLLCRGADPLAKAADGRTPADVARAAGQLELSQRLAQATPAATH